MNRSLWQKSSFHLFMTAFVNVCVYYCWETVEGKSADTLGNKPQQHLSVVVRISFVQQIYRDKYILKG